MKLRSIGAMTLPGKNSTQRNFPLQRCHHKSQADCPRRESSLDSDRPASGMILTEENQSSWSKTYPGAVLTGLELNRSLHSDRPQINSLDRCKLSRATYRRIEKMGLSMHAGVRVSPNLDQTGVRCNVLFPHQHMLPVTQFNRLVATVIILWCNSPLGSFRIGIPDAGRALRFTGSETRPDFT
jgi:hypothetical protein